MFTLRFIGWTQRFYHHSLTSADANVFASGRSFGGEAGGITGVIVIMMRLWRLGVIYRQTRVQEKSEDCLLCVRGWLCGSPGTGRFSWTIMWGSRKLEPISSGAAAVAEENTFNKRFEESWLLQSLFTQRVASMCPGMMLLASKLSQLSAIIRVMWTCSSGKYRKLLILYVMHIMNIAHTFYSELGLSAVAENRVWFWRLN